MKYIIKDADGNITNNIVADAEFVEANFEHYELYVAPTPVEPTAEESERMSDHPQRDAHITYREALRQWPSTDSFPATRPELGE
jgi:hypothetical protein